MFKTIFGFYNPRNVLYNNSNNISNISNISQCISPGRNVDGVVGLRALCEGDPLTSWKKSYE